MSRVKGSHAVAGYARPVAPPRPSVLRPETVRTLMSHRASIVPMYSAGEYEEFVSTHTVGRFRVFKQTTGRFVAVELGAPLAQGVRGGPYTSADAALERCRELHQQEEIKP